MQTGRSPEYLAHVSPDGTRSQTVLQHLEAVARMAAEFAAPFGGAADARLAGLLHDIGKYSAAFQRRLRQMQMQGSAEQVDHSTAGAVQAFGSRAPQVAFAVAGHHGGIPDIGGKGDDPGLPTLQARLHRTVEPHDTWRSQLPALPDAALPAFARTGFAASFYIRMLFSCLVDADYLDTESFMAGSAPPRGRGETIPQLLQKLEAYVLPWMAPETELNRRRCRVLLACRDTGRTGARGLYSLTVPTGGGKTVASLAFALEHARATGQRRIIYVIPYTSIIDQTAEKFREILGADNVLEHHSGADFLTGESPTPAQRRKALAAENWDSPVVVTTAVQFFESLFSNRPGRCRKLHNIADSVIIFDEAQTLPVPQLRPCVAAIAQLVQNYGATAVLCTATQPALGPLFGQAAPGLAVREIAPDPAGLYAALRRTTLQNEGELSAEALGLRLCGRPQVLCVVNRRETAQALYRVLPAEGSYCLTTLLYPAHRRRLLEEIRKRLNAGLACRVVSTSLIEAGVDVDFPDAWREEAGLDSVLQTAGRCNREGKNPPEQSLLHIFRLAGCSVPAMLKLNVSSARRVLNAFADPAGPDAIREYFTFYRSLKGDAALDRDDILELLRRFEFARAAERFRLIDSPAVTVYVPRGEGAQLIAALRAGQHSRALFRRLGQYGVTVYPDHLKELCAAHKVENLDGVYILQDDTLYDDLTGLAADVPQGTLLMV